MEPRQPAVPGMATHGKPFWKIGTTGLGATPSCFRILKPTLPAIGAQVPSRTVPHLLSRSRPARSANYTP